MPQYTFIDYSEEKVDKGKSGYYKMTVNYSAKGESKSKNIMSFANPTAYDTIKKLNEGDLIDVEFVKDDKYYNWASVKKAEGNDSPKNVDAPKTAPAARSTYETPEERAKKQVYIIKQSCLAQAAAYSANRTDGYPSIKEHLEIAQQFVDWVLDDGGTQTQD